MKTKRNIKTGEIDLAQLQNVNCQFINQTVGNQQVSNQQYFLKVAICK